ncbi:MAG: hypothetical protein HY822_09895 [Acidobacteria bacterium]|nr:hypothetical protein [Acidobacteriota bacterium]
MRVRAVFPWLAFPMAAALWGQVSMPAYWRYTPPAPSLLLGLDWRQASQSSLSALAAASVNLEFAEQLGSILVTAEPGAAKGRFLAVATGRFNVSKLRRMAAAEGARTVRFRGLEIFSAGGVEVTVAGDGVLLAGDAASLRAALERGGTVTPRDSAIWRQAADLTRRYSLWAVSTEALPVASPLLAGVRSFAGGVAFERGLQLALDLNTASEDSAQTLAEALERAPGLHGLVVRAEGSDVRLTATVDAERPEASLKKLSAWILAPPEAAPELPPPPRRKTILIVGLDEGTREIPLRALQR